MGDVFELKNRQDFVDYAQMCIKHIATAFPDCEKTQTCLAHFNAMSDDELTLQIDSWKENITTPLDAKQVKYAKAIQNITSQTAQLYHSIVYKDMQACSENLTSKLSVMLDLNRKLEDPCMSSDEHKTNLFKILTRLCHATFECHGMQRPTVPTRDEIKQNIQRRKEKVEEDASMPTAFQTHMNSLCAQLGQKLQLEDADEATIQAWMKRWSRFSSSSTDGAKNATLCQQKSGEVLVAVREAFPELSIQPSQLTDGVWNTMNQLNGFTAVNDSIPTNMMGRIESMASKLAEDIVSGKTDMANVNLSDIGQQVLSGCSEDDMSKFAGNLDTLLPALQSFR